MHLAGTWHAEVVSASSASAEQTHQDAAGPVGLTPSGALALPLALIALAGLGLTPWLAYIPVLIAAGLFMLVMWLGVIDTFVRGPVVLRIVAGLLAAWLSTALFWASAPGWSMLPLLWSVLAAISTRTPVWAVTACLAAAYGTGLVGLIL